MLKDEYKPERKVVAAAVVTVGFYIANLVWPDFQPPVGVEGAAAVIVAYFIPN